MRLSEILIPTPENADETQVAQAQAKAQEVATKLQGGAKFADLAKQYSGGQTADKGGDLGQFEKGQLAKVLEDQTFPLQPGQWTQPIRTRQGFVVLEVTEHNGGGVPPLKDVEEQVQEGMYQEEMQPALRKISDQPSREGLHRHRSRLRGFGRLRERGEARVRGQYASAG